MHGLDWTQQQSEHAPCPGGAHWPGRALSRVLPLLGQPSSQLGRPEPPGPAALGRAEQLPGPGGSAGSPGSWVSLFAAQPSPAPASCIFMARTYGC